MSERLLISVVDDDQSIRESLPDLLRACGYDAEVFASAEDFLAAGSLPTSRCLIIDMYMPGLSGPELQAELVRRGSTIPVIFITARKDEELRRDMLARGAVDCLFKPFSEAALLAALGAALGTP